MTSEVKFRPIVNVPEWNSIMAIDEFRKRVFKGEICEKDGTGYYAKSTQVSNVTVGNIFTDEVPEWATRIVWYSK